MQKSAGGRAALSPIIGKAPRFLCAYKQQAAFGDAPVVPSQAGILLESQLLGPILRGWGGQIT